MKSAFGTLFLYAAGVFSLLTTLSSVANPVNFGRRLGLLVGVPDGFNEIRAQYGGFFFAVAVVNALVLAKILPRNTGYVIDAALFGGLFLGRLISLFLDGGFSHYGATIGSLFFIDGIAFALSLTSLLLERSSMQLA